MKKKLLIVLFITGVCFGQTYDHFEDTYSNGFPKVIKTYKDSKGKFDLIKSISLYNNRQKKKVETYKDGKRDGLWTEWYENGQKETEGTYKDGKEDGLFTKWSNDGLK